MTPRIARSYRLASLADPFASEESLVRQRSGLDHRGGPLERRERTMGIRADREACAHPLRSLEELAMRDAVRLVHLEGDIGVEAEPDEPLLPVRGIRAFHVAEGREWRHRAMARASDPSALKPA